MGCTMGKIRLPRIECSSGNEFLCGTDRPVFDSAACTTSSEQGSGRWFDALTIALGQASDSKWYTSTMELQLASFEVCVACRGVRTLRVTVNKRMPLSLWGNEDAHEDLTKPTQKRRLPALRAAGVAWTLPAGMLVPLLSEAALLKEVEWMQRTGIHCVTVESTSTSFYCWGDVTQPDTPLVHSPRSYFEAMLACLGQNDLAINTMQNMGRFSWPPALRQLSLGCITNENVDWASFPSSLERLALGGRFDQRMESVTWPVSLKHLTLGGCFDQPIEDVVWPVSLLQLTFGVCFNQPIVDVVWPSRLQRLTFVGRFDQPITDVVWPASLHQLGFGYCFDQPIADVVWPAPLQQLAFGSSFNQPIDGVVWPSRLTHLVFGDDFDHAIDSVSWPSALISLAFGRRFDQSLDGVVWPSSLKLLAFGEEFLATKPSRVWPSTLEDLVSSQSNGFGQEADQFDWLTRMDLFDEPNIVSVVNL